MGTICHSSKQLCVQSVILRTRPRIIFISEVELIGVDPRYKWFESFQATVAREKQKRKGAESDQEDEPTDSGRENLREQLILNV